MIKIAIIMTIHNRINETLKCLRALFNQEGVGCNFSLIIFIPDDGSTDGTAGAVRERYPGVKILPGTGDLYWNRGMHLAFREAMQGDYDFYLWLNDDTLLYPDAVQRLLETSKQFDDKAIIVGSVQDPDTGAWTYGGFVRRHPRRPCGSPR